jgi:ABC-type spermidine/putrescine transport system permease subunit II
MIQRIQSIYLFLAAACCVAFLFLPTWMVVNPDTGDGGSKSLFSTPMCVVEESSTMSIDNPFSKKEMGLGDNLFLGLQFGLACFAAAVLLGAIFLYGNRRLQGQVVLGGILLLMLVIIMVVPVSSWLEELGGNNSISGDLYQSLPRWGLAAPGLALLMAWMARRRIAKDEKMVRDMDRIR